MTKSVHLYLSEARLFGQDQNTTKKDTKYTTIIKETNIKLEKNTKRKALRDDTK